MKTDKTHTDRPRLEAIDPATATGKSKELLERVQARFGGIPNLIRTFAHSPAVLQGYLEFSGALASGSLPARLREQIALVVSEVNDCDYCRAAHTAAGKKAGLSAHEVLDSRQATAGDPRVQVVLRFARDLTANDGWVGDEDVARLRDAGYVDGEIAEIVANVALTIFTNYFNHVAGTEVDFPAAKPLPVTA